MEDKEKYTDKSGDRKYFAVIPYYIVNHSSAYEQSLYLVMKRIASEEGTCWASAITIGKIMKVSPNTVRKYRDKLLKRGWIKVIGSKGKTKPTNEFELVDLWKMNVDYYVKKESSTVEQSNEQLKKKVQLVSLVSSTVGNKEETIKKKPTNYMLVDKIVMWITSQSTTIDNPEAWVSSLISKYGDSLVDSTFEQMNHILNPSPAKMAVILKKLGGKNG